MSDELEEKIRAAMRSHDADITDSLDVDRLPSPGHRPTHRMAVAAAAAVVLAVGGAVAVVQATRPPTHRPEVMALHPTDTSTSGAAETSTAACPKNYVVSSTSTPWVPAAPTTSDGSHRLVPDRVPTSAVACAYLGDPHGGRQLLTGGKQITGNLDQIPATLSSLPHSDGSGICAGVGRNTDGDDYLLLLRYGNDRVWVSAPAGDCRTSTNGRFRAGGDVNAPVTEAYQRGRWPAPTSESSDAPSTAEQCSAAGRLGQDRRLVPDSPTSVTICTDDAAGEPKKVRSEDAAATRTLAVALNALPTRKSDHESTNMVTRNYQLVFHYDSGSALMVFVMPGATPPVDNGSLQATSLGSVLSLIE